MEMIRAVFLVILVAASQAQIGVDLQMIRSLGDLFSASHIERVVLLIEACAQARNDTEEPEVNNYRRTIDDLVDNVKSEYSSIDPNDGYYLKRAGELFGDMCGDIEIYFADVAAHIAKINRYDEHFFGKPRLPRPLWGSRKIIKTCLAHERQTEQGDGNVVRRGLQELVKSIRNTRLDLDRVRSHAQTISDQFGNFCEVVKQLLQSLNPSVTEPSPLYQTHDGQLLQSLNPSTPEPMTPSTPEPSALSPTHDCKTILEAGSSTDGVYTINPDGNNIRVVCDMTTRFGGWTVFQQRRDGTVEFYRNWLSYTRGFGDVATNGNYWIGLENIHQLTQTGTSELMVKLRTAGGVDGFAHYSRFSIDGSENNYAIHVTGYSGNDGDSLAYVNGMQFGTNDNPNIWDGCLSSCTTRTTGPWWYKCCSLSSLNGEYLNTTATLPRTYGMRWYNNFRTNSMMESTMMIRRRLS